MKKILYFGAFGLWDIISSIPKWYEIHESGNELYILRYDKSYFKFLFDADLLENIIKNSKIVSWLLIIPYNKLKLLWFFVSNFRKFDIVYIPIKTKINNIVGHILWKTVVFVFDSIYDTKWDKNLVTWQVNKDVFLYDYKKFFLWVKRENNILKAIWNNKYVVLYPWKFECSLLPVMWKKIVSFIAKKWYKAFVVWWKREAWLFEDLADLNNTVVNCIDKTSFWDLVSILEWSSLNICCDGGIMWLSSLLNNKNIVINVLSRPILLPPVDWKKSFIISSKLICSRACAATSYRFSWIKWVPCCDFYWTENEACCKKSIDIEQILNSMNSIL